MTSTNKIKNRREGFGECYKLVDDIMTVDVGIFVCFHPQFIINYSSASKVN